MTDSQTLYQQGQMYLLQGQQAQAISHFTNLANQPDHKPWGQLGLATLYARSGQWLDGLGHVNDVYNAGLRHPDVYEMYSYICAQMGNLPACVKWCREGLEHRPASASLLARLATALYKMHDHPAALEAYRAVLKVNPTHAESQHMVQALGGTVTAPRANPTYVQKLFDSFTDFDSKLTGELGYRTPQELMTTFREATGLENSQWEIVDLGCGTGLMGPLLAPYTRHLVGVDLSSGMMAKANERGYHELVTSDLTGYLAAQTERFDAALCADTFVYIGDLADTFAHTHAALKAPGYFAFSTEDAPGSDGYVLKPTGRYGHSAAYIEQLAAAHGFNILSHRQTVIRQEGGQPIQGHLYVLQKA